MTEIKQLLSALYAETKDEDRFANAKLAQIMQEQAEEQISKLVALSQALSDDNAELKSIIDSLDKSISTPFEYIDASIMWHILNKKIIRALEII